MADEIYAAVVPRSTTSSNAANTSQATANPNESSTQYKPIPFQSPAGPHHEDSPPSYDFALSDARSSGILLDGSRVEAHSTRALEGREPGEHVGGSQSISVPVGRTGGFTSLSTPTTIRSAPAVAEPPHPVPPGQSPGISNGSSGPVDSSSRANGVSRGGERRERGSRSSQDWATFGQNVGRWGEQFGRKMSALGKQFGQRTEQWASAYSAGGGGYNPPPRLTPAVESSTAEQSAPPQYDHPPSYEAPAADAGQGPGFYRNPSRRNTPTGIS